jgi:Mrp family chromosome partitioning ATPase
VTLAEESDRDGRPLAAVALARALAGRDRSVVLVDLRDDGADDLAMGEAADLPGFADLLAGEVSFAQVIFRDRRSRAHFIPAGTDSIDPEALAGERLATLLAALDHTYDHIVLDCPDDAIPQIAPGADAALVASEYGSADPRTLRAVARVAKASAARIFHLQIDPGRRPSDPDPERTAEAA